VPVDLSGKRSDLGPAGSVLGEVQNAHEDFEQFFGDVFDQLHSLSLELFARHRHLESLAAQQRSDSDAKAQHAADLGQG
jgi:hypothetical protein